MLGVKDTSMDDLPESKLDIILKAIETFLMRTNHIEDFDTRL